MQDTGEQHGNRDCVDPDPNQAACLWAQHFAHRPLFFWLLNRVAQVINGGRVRCYRSVDG